MIIQPVSGLIEYTPASASKTLSGSGSTADIKKPESPDSTSGASGTRSYDKMDLNKDGYVSALEELLYALDHPGETTSVNLAARYNQHGSLSVNTNEMPRLIDISV